MKLTKIDFERRLSAVLSEASQRGDSYADVNAGNLHREVGIYPKRGHRMPTCCSVMRGERRSDDVVLQQPLKGNGASLTIRYRLPR